MFISLLCPTKHRVANIERLIDNLIDNTTSFNQVELLIMCDCENESDVDEIIEIINKNIGKINLNLSLRTYSDYLNRDYYNELSSKVKGDFLFVIADDVEFITTGWDKILKEKIDNYLRQFKDRIVYVAVDDGSKTHHPSFPIISREAVDVLGFLLHPQIMTWGADRCIWEVYKGVDRVLEVPEIKIEHLSYHTGKGVFDSVSKSVRERFFRDPEIHNKVSRDIVPQNIETLKKYIEEKNK